MKNLETVDAYIASLSKENWQKIHVLRELVYTVCPDAQESMNYGMPAYKYNGKPLIYFAAFTHHVGIYATPTAHEKFAKQLSWYKQGKWSVQFPLDQDLPLDLIKNMIVFNMEKITQG